MNSTFELAPSLRTLRCINLLIACASVLCVGNAVAGPPHPRVEVGTRCQQEYQNGWQVDVGSNDVWRRCSNFNDQIKKTENLEFYYNLHGAQSVIEKGNDGWLATMIEIDPDKIILAIKHKADTVRAPLLVCLEARLEIAPGLWVGR